MDGRAVSSDVGDDGRRVEDLTEVRHAADLRQTLAVLTGEYRALHASKTSTGSGLVVERARVEHDAERPRKCGGTRPSIAGGFRNLPSFLNQAFHGQLTAVSRCPLRRRGRDPSQLSPPRHKQLVHEFSTRPVHRSCTRLRPRDAPRRRALITKAKARGALELALRVFRPMLYS